jgi:hypothetical protein
MENLVRGANPSPFRLPDRKVSMGSTTNVGPIVSSAAQGETTGPALHGLQQRTQVF